MDETARLGARWGQARLVGVKQGRQFTSVELVGVLSRGGVAISMASNSCWRKNVFVERLCRSVKHEEACLHACDSWSAAREGIAYHLGFDNSRRPGCFHKGRAPYQIHYGF